MLSTVYPFSYYFFFSFFQMYKNKIYIFSLFCFCCIFFFSFGVHSFSSLPYFHSIHNLHLLRTSFFFKLYHNFLAIHTQGGFYGYIAQGSPKSAQIGSQFNLSSYQVAFWLWLSFTLNQTTCLPHPYQYKVNPSLTN